MSPTFQPSASRVNPRSKTSKHINLRNIADTCTKCRIAPGSAEEMVVVNGEKYHEHHAPRR